MNKKNILVITDDIRYHSGIARVAKDIIVQTCSEFNYYVIGSAINHPDVGALIDYSNEIKTLAKETSDVIVKIIPYVTYGDENILNRCIDEFKIDLLFIITDPRYYEWLFNIENVVRTKIPISYYNVWDNLPDPKWNAGYYASCDQLISISKQTYGINNRILTSFGYNYEPDQLLYIPHGINSDTFKPISKNDSEYTDLMAFRQHVVGSNDIKFILLYNNRNMERKRPSDVMHAFKIFCDMHPDYKKHSLLVMHTKPIDEFGTDLYAIYNDLCYGYNIYFSTNYASDYDINLLYNISDVTINIASNEGFGLTTAESLMAGKPIIANNTGGLQDQFGFKDDDGEYLTEADYVYIESNSDFKYSEHGCWVKPLKNIKKLKGSIPTPYIFDEICDVYEVADYIKESYDTPKEKLKEQGELGREYMLKNMHVSVYKKFIFAFNNCISNFKPKKHYSLHEL